MRGEVLKCDHCGKQSEDICGDVDWIRIEASKGSITFKVSAGRGEDRCHKSKYIRGYNETVKQADFCSTECMLGWMGLEKTNIKAKEPVEFDINHTIMITTKERREKDSKISGEAGD